MTFSFTDIAVKVLRDNRGHVLETIVFNNNSFIDPKDQNLIEMERNVCKAWTSTIHGGGPEGLSTALTDYSVFLHKMHLRNSEKRSSNYKNIIRKIIAAKEELYRSFYSSESDLLYLDCLRHPLAVPMGCKILITESSKDHVVISLMTENCEYHPSVFIDCSSSIPRFQIDITSPIDCFECPIFLVSQCAAEISKLHTPAILPDKEYKFEPPTAGVIGASSFLVFKIANLLVDQLRRQASKTPYQPYPIRPSR